MPFQGQEFLRREVWLFDDECSTGTRLAIFIGHRPARPGLRPGSSQSRSRETPAADIGPYIHDAHGFRILDPARLSVRDGRLHALG